MEKKQRKKIIVGALEENIGGLKSLCGAIEI
jgi:hypothetical protein